jgi:acyl carrier protein
MLPSAFVRLDKIPLTPSGKVDRRALPDPGQSRLQLDTPYVAPRTPIEEQLAKTWADILSLDHVGVDDNFFDLGGHSLAATRVVSQLIKQFQIEVTLRSLFESPTVSQMATVIVEHQGKKLDENELNRILADLESLSEAEATRLVEEV